MGEVIDITTWRQGRAHAAPASTDPPREGKALGRVLRAHAAWAAEREARWLWSLLSQVADAAPGDLAFTLDGLPVPPAVRAWLSRGEQVLAMTEPAIVRLWLVEVHHWRWRDREPAARAWARVLAAVDPADSAPSATTVADPALPPDVAAWLDIAAERDGVTREVIVASLVAGRSAAELAVVSTDDRGARAGDASNSV